jgi:hypothetical protein
VLRPWRAREREPIWGSGGFAPSGVRGNAPGGGSGGLRPPEAEGFITCRGMICIIKMYINHEIERIKKLNAFNTVMKDISTL